MDSELYKTIYNLLQNQNELHFTTKSGGQGGEIIEVFLNEKHIGEVYMYDNKQDRWANVPHGTEEELNLGQDVKQWIYAGGVDGSRWVWAANDHNINDNLIIV